MQLLGQQLFAKLIATAATFIACITTFINYRQARLSSRSEAARVYLEFSNRYNAPEIAEALIALVAWKKKYGGAFLDVFVQKFFAREEEALAVNYHRRTLNRYFDDVAKAYEARVLSKHFARLAADHSGAMMWRQIAVPMTLKQYGREESRSLRVLSTIVPHFGEGEIG